MGYMHINNLYKEREILNFRECYAMEKIHGTSAHISYTKEHGLKFFSGGVKQGAFEALFNKEQLLQLFQDVEATVYGEAYGGSCQKMSNVYGKELRFIAFDVQIGGLWLAVPQAEEFVNQLGLEFTHYVRVPTEIEVLNRERDKPSTQAIRNGMGDDKESEGVVLRPLVEYRKNNGERVIVKHKREKFRETSTPREVSPEKLAVLDNAKSIALEWVTPMRLQHVLDKIDNPDMTKMQTIIRAMQEDVQREAEGEIVWSNEVAREIGKLTAQFTKNYFQGTLQ